MFTLKDDDDFSEDDRKIVEKIAKYLDLQAAFQEKQVCYSPREEVFMINIEYSRDSVRLLLPIYRFFPVLLPISGTVLPLPPPLLVGMSFYHHQIQI